MKNWKGELDALVAETMAFVKAVLPAASTETLSAADIAPTDAGKVVASPEIASPTSEPSDLGEQSTASERAEIERRLANFKAHQDRWTKEREEYANSVLDRIKPRKPN